MGFLPPPAKRRTYRARPHTLPNFVLVWKSGQKPSRPFEMHLWDFRWVKKKNNDNYNNDEKMWHFAIYILYLGRVFSRIRIVDCAKWCTVHSLSFDISVYMIYSTLMLFGALLKCLSFISCVKKFNCFQSDSSMVRWCKKINISKCVEWAHQLFFQIYFSIFKHLVMLSILWISLDMQCRMRFIFLSPKCSKYLGCPKKCRDWSF